jgi:peptide/nickel transport system permease protein
MITFIVRRLLGMIPTFLIVSFIVFFIIQLPPSNWIERHIENLALEQGTFTSERHLQLAHELTERYNLDRPYLLQYGSWILNFLRGDMGESFEYGQEVSVLLAKRIPYSIMISLLSLFFVYSIGIPIGIYCALNQNKISDTIATIAGFIGLSIPNFFLALILMVFGLYVLDLPVGGLFSPEYEDAPWSFGKFIDFLQHVWVAVVVIGTAGTAGIIRVVRGNLLDVLGEPYITALRAKGLPEKMVTIKHAVRISINPVITGLGMWLPSLISGETIVSIVMNIPTAGPLLFGALQSEDIYLSGSILMVLCLFLLIGNLLADIALAWFDPRIRYD